MHRPLELWFPSGHGTGVVAVAVAAWEQLAAPEGIDPHSPAAPGEAHPSPLDTRRPASSANAAVVDLQRQMNELRSDLLDERSWSSAS